MRRLTAGERDRLDRFLLEIDDDDAMLLTTLDGLLCGVIVCPELIPPSEWLAAIWGGGDGMFENIEEANEILGLIMIRYNENIHALGRGRFEPIMDEDNDYTPLWEFWMEGFFAAMALRPESWTVYEENADEEIASAFRCIASLGLIALREAECPEDLADALNEGADRLIAECVESLHAARLALPQAVPAGTTRVGRNDPCPCGSGKKFKKCCLDAL
jgi:uncharacterized protein